MTRERNLIRGSADQSAHHHLLSLLSDLSGNASCPPVYSSVSAHLRKIFKLWESLFLTLFCKSLHKILLFVTIELLEELLKTIPLS